MASNEEDSDQSSGVTYFKDFIRILESEYAFGSVDSVLEDIEFVRAFPIARAKLERRGDGILVLKSPIGRGDFALIELEFDIDGVLQPVMGGFLQEVDMASRAHRDLDEHVPRHTDFDEFLAERGVLGKVKSAVDKRIVAYLLDERRKECGISKAALARSIGTSRTQIDRVLDPKSQNITLETLNRVADALGKRIRIELID